MMVNCFYYDKSPFVDFWCCDSAESPPLAGASCPRSLLVGQKPDRKWSTSLPSRPQPVCTSATTHRVYSGTVLALMPITVVYVDDATYYRYKSAPGYYGVCPRAEDPIHVYQVSTRKRGHCNFANLRETHIPYTTSLETVVEVLWKKKKRNFFSSENPKLLGFIQSSKPPLGSHSEMIHWGHAARLNVITMTPRFQGWRPGSKRKMATFHESSARITTKEACLSHQFIFIRYNPVRDSFIHNTWILVCTRCEALIHHETQCSSSDDLF